MTLINDVLGVGLSFGMTLSSPTCPTIEVTVGESGKIVVLRQTGTGGDAREQHSRRHLSTRRPRASWWAAPMWAVYGM